MIIWNSLSGRFPFSSSFVWFGGHLSCLRLSGFLGPGWLFPFPFYGSFQRLSPQVFSHGLSFCLLFWDSYGSNVEAFNIVPEVSEVVLISFNYFFLFSSLLHLFPRFYLPPHLSYLLPHFFLLVPSRVPFGRNDAKAETPVLWPPHAKS